MDKKIFFECEKIEGAHGLREDGKPNIERLKR